VPQDHPYDASKTVAIIGAGAGGSSAAFFISKAKERYGLDIDVHVYEKNDYVGGSARVSSLCRRNKSNISN
jgi:prenylcysteine oxidase/farnesylcysteine lyase